MTPRRPSLDESQRHPLLTPSSQARLRSLQEHPDAPRYSYACGDMLTAPMLAQVQAYRDMVRLAAPAQAPTKLPSWLVAHVRRVLAEVPLYRSYAAGATAFSGPAEREPGPGGMGEGMSTLEEATSEPGWSDEATWQAFSQLPTTSRDDLARSPWLLVPDSAPLGEMMVYDTSGTTASSVQVASHPVCSSTHLVLLEQALALHGVQLEGGDRVSIVLVADRGQTLTYPSVSSYLGGAGFVKLNLRESEWPDPTRRAAFLDDCNPEVYTGDPLSFASLARLPLHTRPKALISTAMALSPGLRASLEERFGCPIIDIYSLTECRAVAVGTPHGHRILAPDTYVEIVDPRGQPCPLGVRGEVTLSGGQNPFLPLLRYRTGDHASLALIDGAPYLQGLEGRAPVRFLSPQGTWVNNIDVTQALAHLPLAAISLHQHADGHLTLRRKPESVDEPAIRSALSELHRLDTSLELLPWVEDPLRFKVVRYSTDLAEGLP